MKITELLIAELDQEAMEFAKHWSIFLKAKTIGSPTRNRCPCHHRRDHPRVDRDGRQH